ncbi:MAG: Na/Pi cotransporter family protein, partial [Bdellovibrionales bacterium]|nr:Na/Pi cotransporter family protein [Bdellovibrionales bacterium]
MEKIEYWKFIAGLGFFLFGMTRMEEALKELAGRSFKRFLRHYTTNHFLSIINGALTTAVLQSSSVVTLMILAFVGAEIITLGNALGIILGANLGTTFTGWVVASLGFKMDLEALVLPLIGIGCSGLVFLGPRFRFYHFLAFMAGLGFLFMGLDFMKSSMETLSQSVSLEFLAGWGAFAYLLFGAGFTALIQSSSATMMITLSALNADILTLHQAAALVIGADLGTTVTALLGAAQGTPTKKRVAMAHFLFNLVTDLLA